MQPGDSLLTKGLSDRKGTKLYMGLKMLPYFL